MPNVYINKKESKALYDAEEQVRNVLEGCTADSDSPVLKMLYDTIKGINSITSKL
jgi:hypothetical protein